MVVAPRATRAPVVDLAVGRRDRRRRGAVRAGALAARGRRAGRREPRVAGRRAGRVCGRVHARAVPPVLARRRRSARAAPDPGRRACRCRAPPLRARRCRHDARGRDRCGAAAPPAASHVRAPRRDGVRARCHGRRIHAGGRAVGGFPRGARIQGRTRGPYRLCARRRCAGTRGRGLRGAGVVGQRARRAPRVRIVDRDRARAARVALARRRRDHT